VLAGIRPSFPRRMMNEDSLEFLLDRLCQGDDAAAERVFCAYEPYLRMVVRRQLPERLRSRFDSVDIVQSMWADVLQGFRSAGLRFTDSAHLRAFLVKAARNRFIDRYRRHDPAVKREQRLSDDTSQVQPASHAPRPSEEVQADELWQQMLELCPAAHHDVLRLKRQGLRLAEIAERTGLHADSIRRILRTLARRLALTPRPATLPPNIIS
jgi:RNA polymerase sigma factor (sigma-70 family)